MPSQKNRPPGLMAAIGAVTAIGLLTLATGIPAVLGHLSHAPRSEFAGVGVIAAITRAVGVLLTASWAAIASIGLWRFRPWSRPVSLVLCGTLASFEVLGLASRYARPTAPAALLHGLRLALTLALFAYLVRPGARRLFQDEPSR